MTEPKTVSISVNAQPGHGYRSTGEVVLDKLMTAYHLLRYYLDADPGRGAFKYSVEVFKDLMEAGWPMSQARRYSQAARLAYDANLDPATGRPLVGIAAVHPVYVDTAVSEVAGILDDQVANDLISEEVARKIVTRLADLGWRFGS